MACSSITAVCLHPPTPSSSLLVLGYGIHLRIQCEYIWWWYSHEVVVNSLRPHRLSPSRIRLFETPWTVALQATPSMEFPRQKYWSGLPFPSPGDLPHPEIEPMSLVSPALQADSLPAEQLGKPLKNWVKNPKWLTFKTREVAIAVAVKLCSREDQKFSARMEVEDEISHKNEFTYLYVICTKKYILCTICFQC